MKDLSVAIARTYHDRRARNETSGQMTIEFVVMFPVMLMIALVAFNSVLFLAECAAFDRIFRESVCVFAPSPASDESPDRICAQVEGQLNAFEQKSYLSCDVTQSAQADGCIAYTGTLFFTPSIFGAYPMHRVFDIALQPIQHSIRIDIDAYRPGVFL